MEGQDENTEYPDPQTSTYGQAYHSQYPNEYGSAAAVPYGDPLSGGLWQSTPSALTEADGLDVADEVDFDEDLRGAYARHQMDTILHGPLHSDPDRHATLPGASSAGTGLEGSEAIDPDFELADQDDEDEDSDASFDSDILDQILQEEFGGPAPEAPRGRGRPRGRPRGSGRASGRASGALRGRRGWKWAIKGTSHDDKGEKGTKRPRGSGTGRGRGKNLVSKSTAADPGPEFKRQQSLATEKYFAGEYEEAAELARAAVRANPEVFAAHSLLSEILLAQGKDRDALTVLLAGAHTKRDPILWRSVAMRTRELAGDDPDAESLDSAAYCLAWAIRINPEDVDSRRERLNFLLESYAITDNALTSRRARNECRNILKRNPSEILVAREYAELAATTKTESEMRSAKKAYDEALELQTGSPTLGPAADQNEQWSHCLAYIGLVEQLDGNKEAIRHFKRLSRWVQSRQNQSYWDQYPTDDREFDSSDEPRKIQVAQYREAKEQAESLPDASIPPEIRIKLGFYRLALGNDHHAEAIRHFDYLLADPSNVSSLADLFREVADVMREKSMYAEAVRFYEPLQSVPDVLDTLYYMHLGVCYLKSNRAAEAEDCFKLIVENNNQDWQARLELVKLYESQSRQLESAPLIEDIINLGHGDSLRKNDIGKSAKDASKEQRRAKDKDGSTVTPRRARRVAPRPPRQPGQPSKYSNEVLERQRRRAELLLTFQSTTERVQAALEAVESCEDDVASGDEQAIEIWKTSIKGLVEEFVSCKYFCAAREGEKHQKFTGYGKEGRIMLQSEKERGGQAQNSPLLPRFADPGLPDDYCGIRFSTWLDLFCRFAIHLAKEGSRDDTFDALDKVYACNIFYHSQPASYQLFTTMLSCSLILNDEERITSSARWFMANYPTSPTPFQLFAAVHRLFAGPPNWFNAGPTQKAVTRAIRAWDYNLLPPDERNLRKWTTNERNTLQGPRAAEWAALNKMDPGVLSLYGHVMVAGQTWNVAMTHYFRALTERPNDPMLLLCIALSYIQNSMKRQTDNRHWSIMTGLGFLSKYREVRREMAKTMGKRIYEQEAEYNVARTWHLLGLDHLAAKGYHDCLRIADEMALEVKLDPDAMDLDGKGDVEEAYTQEAVMGLVSIYTLTGQTKRARELTEKYMVI